MERKFKFGTKNALLGIFGLLFWTTIIIFEISPLEFIKMQGFLPKKKSLNLGPKVPYVSILGLQIEKLL